MSNNNNNNTEPNLLKNLAGYISKYISYCIIIHNMKTVYYAQKISVQN